MEVGGEQKGGARSEALDLDCILGTGGDGGAVMTMEKAEQVQGGGMIKAGPESQAGTEPAEAGVGGKGFLFPAYYNKAGDQGKGQGLKIEFI
jgi:hypothetical protein